METKEKLEKQGIQCTFSQASEVSEEELKDMSDSAGGGQAILAIDDASIATASSKNLAHLFTISRHYSVSICVFWHMLYSPSPSSRIISQNSRYIFLLSSPRLQHQVATLGSQLQMRKVLMSAYTQATNEPYGYILVDLSVSTPHHFRIRGHVFKKTEADKQIVFVPNM